MAKLETMIERIEARWPRDVGPFNRLKGPRSFRKVVARDRNGRRRKYQSGK